MGINTFSSVFGINAGNMYRYGVFDPVLDHDTKLFIDPLLLPLANDTEFSDQASDIFQNHFSNLFKLMSHSKVKMDASWKAAVKLLKFPETRFTCLGYGSSSTHGSGFGPRQEETILSIANEIAQVGIKDPYILPLYSLLEKDIGPDKISDMTTKVILPAIVNYTQRVCKHFNVEMNKHVIHGTEYTLPTNPHDTERGPVLLLPLDVLKELPVATSWDEAVEMAWRNEALRGQLNDRLGQIFKDTALSEEEKRKARISLLGSDDAFDLFSQFLKSKSKIPYNFQDDPNGYLFLQRFTQALSSNYPLTQTLPPNISDSNVEDAVKVVIEQYKHLIEEKAFWKELWDSDKPKKESAAQRLFFAAAYAYTQAACVDLNPETSIGNGFIDFKASKGLEKVVVEIKKSNNPSLIKGLEKQLVKYCKSEKSSIGYYIVIDYGDKFGPKNWHEDISKEANRLRVKYKMKIELEFVNAAKQPPPSKA